MLATMDATADVWQSSISQQSINECIHGILMGARVSEGMPYPGGLALRLSAALLVGSRAILGFLQEHQSDEHACQLFKTAH